jgi:hypothetical protein
MMISRDESAFLKRNRRAVIIGGSMSGLFTAAFLRQIGWDVDVYERSKVELVGRGAGITGHPEMFDALQASGAGTERLGIEVRKRIATRHRSCSAGWPWSAMPPPMRGRIWDSAWPKRQRMRRHWRGTSTPMTILTRR